MVNMDLSKKIKARSVEQRELHRSEATVHQISRYGNGRLATSAQTIYRLLMRARLQYTDVDGRALTIEVDPVGGFFGSAAGSLIARDLPSLNKRHANYFSMTTFGT